MSWFWTLIIFLSFTLFCNKLSEARHPPNKLPSAATVVGTVYCDTCFLPKANHFIAGATVAVECKSSSSRPYFRQEVKTNGHGEFRVELPFSVGKHVKQIRGCSVALIRSNDPSCASTAAPLPLKSRNAGQRIFSAGFFTFKPQVCDQKQSTGNGGHRKPISTKMGLLFPPIIPPNPLLPPPSLIPPVLPTPPPSVIPPLFPTPPPSVIPPILPTPPSSPAPFLPLPKIPGLTPSQPPPHSPSLPVPLPPVPGLPPIPDQLPIPPVPMLPLPPVPGLPIPPVPGLPIPPTPGLPVPPVPGLPLPPVPGLPIPPVPGLPIPPTPGLPLPPFPGLPLPPVPGLPIPPSPGLPVPPTPGLPIPPVPGIPLPPIPGLPIPPVPGLPIPGGPPAAQMRKSHP